MQEPEEKRKYKNNIKIISGLLKEVGKQRWGRNLEVKPHPETEFFI